MKTFKKILFLLNNHELKFASLLLFMILITAILEMIGVASILPFMAVLTNPEIVQTNDFLNRIFIASVIIGVENNQQFLLALGILVLILLITSLTFKALTTYFQVRFVLMLEYSVGKRLVQGYLHQPYSWFLNRHSAELGKNILSEAGLVVGSGINQSLEIISKGILVITLIILLLITDPKLALIVGFVLGTAYLLIYLFTRSYLNRIGKQRLESNQERFTAVSEAFGAAKEIKVGGLEQIYIKRFSDPAKIFAKLQAIGIVIAQLPRYVLEAVVFGGMMVLILYLMRQTGSFNAAIPVITLYVFAGYRLMPALQQVYSSFTKLAFFGPSVDKLYKDLKSLEPLKLNQDINTLSLNTSITLKNINYNYPNTSRTALKDINLVINSRSNVGIVGSTGSGKTTTVDIILGLLEAQRGTLEVDGQVITKQNSRAWQRSIGYVPQNIYLSDDTVAANIAIGVDYKDINQEAIERVSKIANLHEFIMNELPKNYQTTIGERGVRLSGGQRQRIGIARALYHNPQVLILDEATSALDNLTEKAIMDAVTNLSQNITIIQIAHRLSSVKNCEKMFLLESGRIKAQGTFNELIKLSDSFRDSVKNI